MNATVIDIALKLLKGYTIAHCGSSGIRVRDNNGNPVCKISERVYYLLRNELMRKDKKTGLHVIDKRKVRGLHGNCKVKRSYRKITV